MDNSGNLVSLANTTISSYTETGSTNSGNYIKVSHFDHGMYSDTNRVVLSDIESNIPPTTLSSNLSSQEVDTISVASTCLLYTSPSPRD